MKVKSTITKNFAMVILTLFWIYPIFSESTALADEEYIPEIPTVWTKYDPDGTFEYNGLKPSCSGFPGIAPEFYFFAKGGTVNKLVIYFEGGGACWFDNMAVSPLYGEPVYKPMITIDTTILEYASGIFDLDNPKNPFKEWSIVYIPYCTGDLHIGANDATYLPGVMVKHRGFVNFQAVSEWIKANFVGPKQIFLTGSSAGGFGTIWNFPFIKEAYPDSRIDFFADAGGIVFWTEADFIMQNDNWDIQAHGLYDSLGFLTGDEQLELLSGEYPDSKGGIWGAEFDEAGAFFTNVIRNPYNPSNWFPIPDEIWCDFHNIALDETTSLIASNYRYYVIEGTVHTFLGKPEFYSENSGGIPLYRWLKAMVNNPLVATGQWQNLACPDCLDPCGP